MNETWEWKEYTLEELLDYEQPSRYIVESTKYNDSYEIPVLTAGKSFIIGKTNEKNNIYKNLPCIIFDDFTTANQYVDFPFKVKSSAMKILTVKNQIVNTKLLYYIMQSIHIDASTHKRYWIQTYSKIKVSIPIHKEHQDLLLRKIEEQYTLINNNIESLELVSKKLNNYRYSVIENCLKLDNWTTIEECIDTFGQGWSPKCINENTIDNDVWAVIKTTAVQPLEFNFSENKILPKTLIPRSQHCIEVDDILITRAGPRKRCGICCLVKETKQKLINCDKVYRIKLKKEKVIPEYFEYVLNSPKFIKEINKCKTGGSDSGVNLTQERFIKIKIPLPSKPEQEIIINLIKEKISICLQMEKIINDIRLQSNSLRISCLQKCLKHNNEEI